MLSTMQEHAQLGYDMLKHSKRPILKTAAIVAYEHHEKYNGTGYPKRLKGDEIHIYGAITAIADVFDALISDRIYKKAWPLEKVLKLFEEEKGEHFHPVLTQLFLDNIEQFWEIREKYKDVESVINPVPTPSVPQVESVKKSVSATTCNA